MAKIINKTITAQTAIALVSAMSIPHLLCYEQARAAETTLLCREIEGVEKSSTLAIDLETKTIRWTWHDMYRDYKITKIRDSKIYASSNDPVFLYELQIDRESLIRAERRKPLFIPGSDWGQANKTACWMEGKSPKNQF